MSKRQKKRIERAMQTFTPAQQTTPISDAMLTWMLQQQSPQKQAVPTMTPGAPLTPYKGLSHGGIPRGWSFPIGWNIGRLSRSTRTNQDVPTFEQLRILARSYDGIQMCIRVWLDLAMKLKIVIKPRPELIENGDDEDDAKYQKDIAKYLTFFEKPDRRHDLHEWLRIAITDQLELDALAIYPRPTRGGDLYGLEILDGSTIKPLLDDRGMLPDPPYPAYQQYLYAGLPGVLLTTDQLIYLRESPRSDSPYGISRVERILTKVNQALRKQQKDLARFTDGNTPAGILQLPPSDTEWTSDELAAYQQMFDALLSGNDAFRSRIKVMPPGTEYKATDEADIMTAFDQFLLNATVASFGLSMSDLGFTEDVNRSSGDSQENMTYRRTMQPLMEMYASLFTRVLQTFFNEQRFVVSWGGFEESEDLQMQASAYSQLVTSGILSPSDAARLMHLPVQCEIPAFIVTTAGPIFLEDLVDPKMRQAQKDAQLAGLQLAATSPQAAKGKPGDEEEEPGQPANDQKGSNSEPAPAKDEEMRADFKRWRQRALDDMKAERTQRRFTSELIAPELHARISEQLQRCASADDVRAVFRDAQVLHWQDTDADTQKLLTKLHKQGISDLTWNAHPGACDACMFNDKKTVKTGSRFPSGAYTTPEHGSCECTMKETRGTSE